MLHNAILSGRTWPRSRSKQTKSVHQPSNQWNISYPLQKPGKNRFCNKNTFISQKLSDSDRLEDEELPNFGEKKVRQSSPKIEAPKLTYDLLVSDSPASSTRTPKALFSRDFLGVSFDSFNSFGSFETVTDVSNLSLHTDADQVERCLADFKPRKISIDSSYADSSSYKNQSQSCIFDYDFWNGSLHGSFSNVSLAAIEAPRAYGVRDLRSETNLSQLKEHILSGQRYQDENDNYLKIGDRKQHRLSRSESNLTEKLRDILIPLNSGYIAYENLLPKRKPRARFKVFASKEEIANDFEEISLGYYESLTYIKKKDIEPCRVYGPGVKNGTAGKRTTFYIFAEKDNTALLKVYITGPRLLPPKYELTALADSFFSVSYVPDRVGWYSISVLWRGKHVVGSPFRVLMLLPKKKVWFKKTELAADHETKLAHPSIRRTSR